MYNQCSIFGSAADWAADVQAQLLTAIWWATLEPWVLPWVSLAVLIEMLTMIFDLSMTVTTRYPTLAESQPNPIYRILDWATPSGKYTHVGTFLWLAYPIFCLARILHLSWPERSALTGFLLYLTQLALFVPSLMYLWNEAAQCALVLSQWSEPRRKYDNEPDGADDAAAEAGAGRLAPASYADTTYRIVGSLTNMEISYVMQMLDVLKQRPSWAVNARGNEVFWVSPSQLHVQESSLAEYHELRASIPCCKQLDAMAERLVKRHYDDGAVVDGWGVICNPTGSRTQAWHWDYTADHSSLFIPVEGLEIENCTQYLAFNSEEDRLAALSTVTSPDVIDIERIRAKLGYVSARQLFPRPFDIMRMDFGAIHRGLSNPHAKLRVVFWISITRNGAVSPAERVYQDFVGDQSQPFDAAE